MKFFEKIFGKKADYEAQKKRFEKAGVIVMQSNEEASALAARILAMKEERDVQ